MFKKIIGILMVLGFIVWFGGYLGFLSNMQPSYESSPAKVDAIVVLTGGQGRITTGLNLLSQKLAKNLFISGVHESVKKTEILSMWDGKAPLPKCCITLGYEAKTTITNATEVKEWVKKNNIRSIILITSDYHMSRALLEFEYIMPLIQIHPHMVTQEIDFSNQSFWKNSWIEYNKLLIRKTAIIINKEE